MSKKFELGKPKFRIEIIDKIMIEAKCNDCKSNNIAITMERIPISNEREFVV